MNKIMLCTSLMLATIAGWCNEDGPTHFVIIVPSYNNEKWCEKNLQSVFSQSYSNWSLYYLDEGSNDSTYQKVQDCIKEHHLESQCIVVQNKETNARIKNIFQTIHQCKSTDVIVLLDGCDWLSHAHVLRTLTHIYSDPNNIYADPQVWVAYRAERADVPRCWFGVCTDCSYSSSDIQRRLLKVGPRFRMSLCTFYAGLFQQIHIQDLQVQRWYLPTCDLRNGFIPVASDAAMMFPMLENEPAGYIRYEQERLYEYSSAHLPKNDCVYRNLRRTIKKWIIDTKRGYSALDFDQHHVVFGSNDGTVHRLLAKMRQEEQEVWARLLHEQRMLLDQRR